MANFSNQTNRGNGLSGTSSTQLNVSLASNPEAGELFIMWCAADNINNVDGDNSECNGTYVPFGLSAIQMNKLGEYTNGGGGAAAGVTVSAWWLVMPSYFAASAGDAPKFTFTSAIVDKCCTAHTFSIAPGYVVRAVAPQTGEVNGANDFPSLTISGLASNERLYVRFSGKEANATTALTATTNFLSLGGTRSRNNAAAQMNRGEFRINTSTGETSAPTLAVLGDTADLFSAFELVHPTILNPKQAIGRASLF